jgi:hypothetical protein
MSKDRKPDLRGKSGKDRPHVTPDVNDVKFAGATNSGVMPSSGKYVTPGPGHEAEGQTSKG